MTSEDAFPTPVPLDVLDEELSSRAEEDINPKAPGALRTIREVADALGIPPHVLRFWESKFPEIKPRKGAGGRRYYRPQDVAFLADLQDLLHNKGMTIRGAHKLLRQHRVSTPATVGSATAESSSAVPFSLPTGGEEGAEAWATTDDIHGSPGTRDSHEATTLPGLVLPLPTLDVTRLPSGELSSAKRHELEAVLSELKSLRALLHKSGV